MSFELVRGAPLRLALLALALYALHAVVHLAGFRDAVGFLSTGSSRGAELGLLYAGSHFAVVLVVPPLLLASLLLSAGRALRRAKHRRAALDAATVSDLRGNPVSRVS